tara:strand:+ start:319 stop:531 length:213 start_codon:yes stop_codon:yes gene_type:complete
MTDQTRWGIPQVQLKNRMREKEEGDLILQIEKLKEELKKTKADLAREKDDRRYDSLVHKKELKELYEKNN